MLVPVAADAAEFEQIPGVDGVLTKPAFGSALFDLLINLLDSEHTGSGGGDAGVDPQQAGGLAIRN